MRPDSEGRETIVWGDTYEQFWLHLPYDGVAAPLRTQIQMACDAANVVVRVSAISSAQLAVKAPRVRRDQVQDDQDHITIFIDPTGAGASAMFVRIGAGGSVSDGIYYASSNRQDTQPDFDVATFAERTASGYAVTLRIPRSALPTHGQLQGKMRYLVLRNVPGDAREVFSSAPLATNTSNLMSASQLLDVSSCGNPAHQISIGATYTATLDEVRAGQVRSRNGGAEGGANLAWSNGITTSVDLTLNPDFSQVELDVPQLQANTQFAINLPEKRSFFLRDVDLFELPTRGSLNDGGGNQAFYSRTITDPDWGARVAYRSRGKDLAALVANDHGDGTISVPGPFYTTSVRQPGSTVSLIRAAMSATQDLRYGVLVADRKYDQSRGRNGVVGADLTWQSSDTWRSRAMVLSSHTDAGVGSEVASDESVPGSYAFWDIVALGRKWETAWTAERASKGFRNDIGYTPQSDFAQLSGLLIRRWRPRSPINNIGLSFKVVSAETTSTHELINRKFAPGIWFGGTHDLDLLVERVPNQRRRTSGYGGKVHETDQWNFRVGGNVSGHIPWVSLSINTGDQIDYELDRVGAGRVVSLAARLRPVEWLEIQPTLNHYEVSHAGVGKRVKETTGQIVANAMISSDSFVRYIGQLRSNRRYALESASFPGSVWPAINDQNALHSLVCSLKLSRYAGLDVGVTRSKMSSTSRDAYYETSAFAKLEIGWARN